MRKLQDLISELWRAGRRRKGQAMITVVDPKTQRQDAVHEERQVAVPFVAGTYYQDHRGNRYRLVGDARHLHSGQELIVLRGPGGMVVCTLLDFTTRFMVQE